MTKILVHPPVEEWSVTCVHVEKVKSFAPTVNHYVADIFIGNPTTIGRKDLLSSSGAGAAVIVDGNGNAKVLDTDTLAQVPSCALTKDGVLSHDWMQAETTN